MQLQLYGKRLWVYRCSVDFRKGIDGLIQVIVGEMKRLPKEGVYLFFNSSRDKVKCLSWHKNGFVLLMKRLEEGKFHLDFNKTHGAVEISGAEFGWLLAGLQWEKMRTWKELNYDKFS